MKRRERERPLQLYLSFGVLALCSCVSDWGEAVTEAQRPNVIVVMTDDQGWGDLSMHGNPVLETPHLDRFAGESARLAEFYVHPVCTPTRSALMTGRHPQRTRAFDTYVGRAMLEPEEVTIAEVMQEAGWRTGIFGKWHLGDCKPMRPLDQGFERAVVHRGGGIGQPSDPIGAESKYTDPVLMDQGEEREFEGYCTDIYFDEAMRWMGETREAGEQFFCYIAPNAPHTPLHDVPKELYEKYKAMDLSQEVFAGGEGQQPAKIQPDKLARLFAMIENIDENMGRLLEFLSEEDLERDTLVVFLCDNGPQGRRFVGGLRGSKGNAYEGGVRSPLFLRWPGALSAGDVEGDFGAHLDLFPTLLDACEIEHPEALELDGRSLLPMLRGEEEEPRHPLVVQWNRGDAPTHGQNAFVRDGKWKLVNFANASPREDAAPWRPELYDLSKDPYEEHDVAKANPEAVERLSATYEAWFEDVGAALPEENKSYHRRNRYGPPPIHIGGEGAERVVLTRQDWRRDVGGGWGQNGFWKVLFNDGGLFAPEQKPWSVRVVLPHKLRPKQVVLGINSGVWTHITFEGELEEGQREVVLEGVQNVWIPGQVATVQCKLVMEDGDESRGPHQLIFSR